MGGVGNGAAGEEWHWNLKPGVAAIAGEDHRALTEKGENHAALAEWGPRGGDSADGAWSLNHTQTSTSFAEIQYPRLGRGRTKDCITFK